MIAAIGIASTTMDSSPTTLQKIRPQLPVRLFNGFGALLEKTRIPSNRLLATDLVATAKRRCGLDDFGEGEFLDALSRLLDSCQDEAQLNLVGKIALKTDVLETLCVRLQMERDRQLHPGIRRQEIREPLFILGLPRSGTSVLHRLLGADPEHRSPLMWEVRSPSPPTRKDEKRRIQRAAQSCNFFNWLAPSFRYVHAVGAEIPQECVSLMTPTFLSDQFDAMYYVPSYRTWMFQQDLRPAYEYHRRFLQHLQFRRPARRWVLKAPTHMFALPALLSVYPDAVFVQTHRTPVDAMASVSSLMTILRRAFSDVVDPMFVSREAIDYWSETMDKFLDDRDRLAESRICDVQYDEIRRDPMRAVRRIYEFFGWSLSREAEQSMRALIVGQAKRESANHRYDLSQFGANADDVLSAFAPYCERFGLSQSKNTWRQTAHRSSHLIKPQQLGHEV
jgi:Sulfotransferase family